MVILPKANRPQYDELPENLKEGLKVLFVEDYREVCKKILTSKP